MFSGLLCLLLLLLAQTKEAMTAYRLVGIFLAEHNQLLALCQAVRVLCRVAAVYADGVYLIDILGNSHQRRHRAERLTEEVHIKTCYDYAHTTICQLAADIDNAIIEELRLVDTHDINLRRHKQNLLWRLPRSGTNRGVVVRYNLILRIADIDLWLEYFDSLVSKLGTAKAANQLLGLTREHRTANNLNPTFLCTIFQKHCYTMLYLLQR